MLCEIFNKQIKIFYFLHLQQFLYNKTHIEAMRKTLEENILYTSKFNSN